MGRLSLDGHDLLLLADRQCVHRSARLPDYSGWRGSGGVCGTSGQFLRQVSALFSPQVLNKDFFFIAKQLNLSFYYM